MKKIYKKIVLMLSLATTLVACDLDREPYDGVEADKLFSTIEGFQTALKGTYGGFMAYGYYSNDGGIFNCPDVLTILMGVEVSELYMSYVTMLILLVITFIQGRISLSVEQMIY